MGGGYFVGPDNRLQTDPTYSYLYDGEGNLIQATNLSTGAVRTLSYDNRNRLIQVVDRDNQGHPTQEVDYAYDAADRRIRTTVITFDASGKATNTKTTFMVYYGANVLMEFVQQNGNPVSSTPSIRYLFGPATDQLLAQQSAGTVH